MVMIAEDVGEDINCVVLPIGALGLLVPSVCVAEVLPWRRIREAEGTPDWMMGLMTWRGESIPVVRFETLNGSTDAVSSDCECVAVMNRCRTAHSEAFYAIATDGMPRMVQVGEADIFPEQTHLGVAESAAVKVGTEQLRIPNLGYLEDQLMNLRPSTSGLLQV